MHKKRKTKKPTKFMASLAITLTLIFFTSVYVSYKVTLETLSSTSILGIKTSNSNSNKPEKETTKSNKPEDKSNSNTNSEKGNINKPVQTSSNKSNSKLYKENITQIVGELELVAKEQEELGNSVVSEEIFSIAKTEEENVEEVTEAIESIETRSKFKTVLFGSDYKNLGQLRSNLVQNRNNIRKLTRTAKKTGLENLDKPVQVQTQLQTLLQERERIMSVITENENQFSFLGWVAKLLAGYTETPVETPEDEILIDEAEELIESTESADTM